MAGFVSAQVTGLGVARLLGQKVDARDPSSATLLARAAAAAAVIARTAGNLGAQACVPRDQPLVAR
jgi:L-alanine-DL-glutamate epimerase-like enolase superfamily enzyme